MRYPTFISHHNVDTRRRLAPGYALVSVVALIFLLTVLLGVTVAHVEYASRVADAYLKRASARSELVSMTNLSWRHLSSEVRAGRIPRASAAERGRDLTDRASLRIFPLIEFEDGEVEVYDLDYDTESLGVVTDPLRFPPKFPRGYMIRATVLKKDMAPLTVESVYVVRTNDVPGAGSVDVLEEEPVYWKELFR